MSSRLVAAPNPLFPVVERYDEHVQQLSDMMADESLAPSERILASDCLDMFLQGPIGSQVT